MSAAERQKSWVQAVDMLVGRGDTACHAAVKVCLTAEFWYAIAEDESLRLRAFLLKVVGALENCMTTTTVAISRGQKHMPLSSRSCLVMILLPMTAPDLSKTSLMVPVAVPLKIAVRISSSLTPTTAPVRRSYIRVNLHQFICCSSFAFC